MFGIDKRKLMDKELELYKNKQLLEIESYRRKKELEIDEEVQCKRRVNWEKVQEARQEAFNEKIKIQQEVSRMEGKKEALSEIMSMKDKEIKYLKELLKVALENKVTVVKV